MDKSIVSTTVRSVRVYTNGCVITCRGTVHLEQGTNAVLVDCLAQDTVEDSLRVRMPASVALLSVNIWHGDVSEMGDAQNRVDACERKIARVNARMGNRSSQKELWLAPAGGNDTSRASLPDLEAYLEHLPARLDVLDDELADLRVQRDALQEELEEARRELATLRRRGQRGLLMLRVDAQDEGIVPFEVELRSPNASWHPVYDVLVDGLEGPLHLRLRAEVRQSTGTDWTDVGLELSTAAPVVRGSLPRLAPMRLRKHVEQPKSYLRGVGAMHAAKSMPSAPMVLEESSALGDTISFEPLVEASAPEATSNVLSNSVEYVVPGTWNVPSDGDDTLVEVKTVSLYATYRWYAVPALDDSVYMVALLGDPIAPEAMGCQASVYLEGEYCGKVVLDEPSGDGPMEISLGVDSRMRVSRKLVRRKSASTLLRGRLSEETSYELEVRSHRDKPVAVTLFDQVPLAEDKDIVVEIGDCMGAARSEETGELRWELVLKPHATERRRFAYTVTRSKGVRIDTVRDESTLTLWDPEWF